MVGSGGGAFRAVVGWTSTSNSTGAIDFDFRLRVGQFLAIASFVFSQLIRSSARRPSPKTPGIEQRTAAATPAVRPVFERGLTMGGTQSAAKWTPIFPHNAIQGYGP